MDYCKVCHVCKHPLKQIPVQKHENLMTIEYYCASCDTSEYVYEDIDCA